MPSPHTQTLWEKGRLPVFLVPLSVACHWLHLPHGSGQGCGDLGLRGLGEAWRHDTAAFSALMITPGPLLGTVGARASRLTCELLRTRTVKPLRTPLVPCLLCRLKLLWKGEASRRVNCMSNYGLISSAILCTTNLFLL